ncbi:MAG TPA: signal peptide peptidase SppA [Phycisphaerales bacterium]|nr:signal peptide peptidase SppA [Phycisphaerales bacterium]
MRTAHAAFVLLLTTLASTLLTACSPRVEIGIGEFPERNLKPATVLADQNAGSLRVAMIDVKGLIMDADKPSLLGAGANPVDRFTVRLAMAENDPSVRAIVVRISSPGGTVTGSDIMYHELRRFAESSRKPVVASMGEIATSGGYYLALAADHIVAEPTTITGSIGVIMPTFNFSEGMRKIGISSRSVKSAANKDIANPFEAPREGHFAILQGLVDEYYARFRSLVLARRKIDPAKVDTVADGRVFSGAQALELGLIDELGGVREAFAAAKKLAGLSRATLVKYSDENYPARTPWAVAPTTEPAKSTLSLRMDLNNPLADLTTQETAGVYYLWYPGME